MKAGAIYYTDSRLDPKIGDFCRAQMRKAFDGEIVSVSLKPLDFGDVRIVLNMERGYEAYFNQIVAGLKASTADYIFFLEHDNGYHPSHFDYTPPTKDKFYYDLNWWKIRADGLAVHWDAVQVSGLVCYRELALKYYASRLATFDPDNFDRKFEPTVNTEYETWWAPFPSIDIRHDRNLTYNKWRLSHFRDKSTATNFKSSNIDAIEGWPTGVIRSILE